MHLKRFLSISLLAGLISVMSFVIAADFDLDMKKLDGGPGSFEEYVGKGKWTLIMFWETSCTICKMQEPEYADFHKRRKDKDAEVIAVSIDGTDKLDLVKDYTKKNSLPYPVMVTDKPELRDKYLALTEEQFRGTPTYLLYAPDGKLLAAQPGMLPVASVEKYIIEQSEK